MISKDDFLNAEFLKQFKDSKDFASFMEDLYVRGTEKMLLKAVMVATLAMARRAKNSRVNMGR